MLLKIKGRIQNRREMRRKWEKIENIFSGGLEMLQKIQSILLCI